MPYDPGRIYVQGGPSMNNRAEPWPGYEAAKKKKLESYGTNPRGGTVVFDSLLGIVDAKTGAPFTGAIPTGGYAINGKWSATPPPSAPAGPNDRPADFPKLVTTVQQPEVADIAKSSLKALPGQSAATMTAFDRLMAEQKQENDTLRQSAANIYDPSGTEAEIRGANKTFEGASRDVLGQMEQRNAEYEARQKANEEAKQAELGRYESAAQAVADRAVARAERAQKGAMASAGGNQGWSGGLSNRYARIYADINTPLQRELSDRRTGLITEGMGLEREYLANNNARLSFNQALNDAFRGNTVQAAQYLQNLRTTLRGLDVQEQERLLMREADMLGLGQKLRSGEITMAQMLQALERSAVDFTYHQPFDPSRIAPTASYDPVMPTPGYQPRTYIPSDRDTVTGTGAIVRTPGIYGDTRYDPIAEEFALSQNRNPLSPEYMGGGVFDLPNRYTFGRTPAQQSAFDDIQRSYE